MQKIIEEIEGLEEFEDLDILGRLQVIKELLKNTINLIDFTMIDTEDDEKTIKKLNKIYNDLKEIL